jgi:hypothetical protein
VCDDRSIRAAITRLLTGECFDLAIIEMVLRDASGIALAAIAANENTPVLLITDRPKVTARLKQYDLVDFPCLLVGNELHPGEATKPAILSSARGVGSKISAACHSL